MATDLNNTSGRSASRAMPKARLTYVPQLDRTVIVKYIAYLKRGPIFQIHSIFEACVLSVFRLCSGGIKFVLCAHFTLCSVQFAATPALRAGAGASRPRGALRAPRPGGFPGCYLLGTDCTVERIFHALFSLWRIFGQISFLFRSA